MSEPDLVITAGFSDAKLVAEANRVVAMYRKKGEEAQKAFQDAQGRVTNTAAARAHIVELERLSKAYDPVYRAAKTYEAEVTRLDRALKVGAITQAQYGAAVQKAATQMQAANGGVQAVAKGVGPGFQMQVQNAAFQIGDFAVQVASGTSASRALAQQMPQLLGGFGMLGAVAGAVVAVAVPLAASFMGSAQSADDLKKRIDGLKQAVADYRDAVDAANLPTAELAKKYGAAATEARSLLRVLSDLSRLDAVKALSDGGAAIDAQLSGLSQIVEGYREAQEALAGASSQNQGSLAALMADDLDRLNREFGLTIDQAEELSALLQARQAATSLEEQADAIRNIATWLNNAAQAADYQNVSLNDAARSASNAALAALEISDASQDAAHATGELAAIIDSIVFDAAIQSADAFAGRISGLIGQARALLSTLGQAAQRNMDAKDRRELLEVERQGLEAGKQRAEIEGDIAAARERQRLDSAGVSLPVGIRSQQIETARENAVAIQTEADAVAKLNAERAKGDAGGGGGSGKGGGGGRKDRDQSSPFDAADRQLQSLEREIGLIGKSTAEVAKARAAWAMLDEAKKQGIPINDALNAQIEAQASKVGELTAALEAGELRQQQFEQAVDGIADAFANALVAGESLRQGLAQVFAGIASDLARSGIHKLLSQFMGGMGGGDPLTGALLAIGLPARASGGPVTAGQPYMVGERGPEPFIPAVNGRILSVAQAQAAMRGGGQASAGGVVRIEIVESPGFAATVRTEAHGVAVQTVAAGITQFDRALPARVQEINANPRTR